MDAAPAAATGPDRLIVHHRSEETEAERILKHFFSHSNLFSMFPADLWTPPTDVYETPEHYVVKIEIAGIDLKEVEIDLTHNVLSVRGHRRDRRCDTKLGYHQMEIHYGYFEKVVTLPHDIDRDSMKAGYRDGFLCVTVGKAPQGRKRKRIEIES